MTPTKDAAPRMSSLERARQRLLVEEAKENEREARKLKIATEKKYALLDRINDTKDKLSALEDKLGGLHNKLDVLYAEHPGLQPSLLDEQDPTSVLAAKPDTN